MLAPPNGKTFDSAEEEGLRSMDTAANDRLPSMASRPKVQKVLNKVSCKDDTPEQVPLLPPVESEIPSTNRKVIAKMLFVMEKLKQPPIFASVLAIFCGAIPFLKSLILETDAPLFFLTDSCLILGEAMIPCILLALGGNLIDGPGVGSKRLGFRTMVAIVFARLVLVPPVGLGIVTLVDQLGFIPNKFVLLLQHSMPTSVLSEKNAFSCQVCGRSRDEHGINSISNEVEELSTKAASLLSTGNRLEASLLYKNVERLEIKLFHQYSIKLLRIRETLLKILLELNDWRDALTYCQLTIPTYQRLYQSPHPMLGLQYYTCGKLEWLLEQTEDALTSFTKAVEILRITHGTNTPFMKELFSKLEEARAENFYKRPKMRRMLREFSSL